jgi:hypothetical protein
VQQSSTGATISKGRPGNKNKAGKGESLIEASSGAGFGVVVGGGFAVAEFFGEAGGVFVAGFLLAGGEDALFGAGEALVGVHAFEEELGGGDGDFGFGLGVDM